MLHLSQLHQYCMLFLLQVMAQWSGTDALTAREHTSNMASQLQQLVQPGVLQSAPAELLQAVAEVEVLPKDSKQAKLRRKTYTR
jgi:hypothetical protein